MPRVTRAALRSVEVLQDVDEAAAIPLPSTPQGQGEVKQRAPLGEIYLNEQEEPKIQLEVNLEKSSKQAPVARKGRAGRKKKDENSEESRPEVVEDDFKRSTSPAAEAAARALSSPENTENFQIPYLDRRPTTPPSKAVRAARRKLSPKPRTPKFNPEIHVSEPVSVRRDEREDSFIAAIETRSPAKSLTSQPVIPEEGEAMEPVAMDDFILEDSLTPIGVTSISPSKNTRIEDSVEAIDALEEALEQMESLRLIREDARTPSGSHERSSSANSANVSKKRITPNSKDTKKTATKPVAKGQIKKVATTKPSTTSTAKPTPPKTSRPTSTKASVSSTKRSSPTDSTTQAKPKARVSSVHKAPFIPAKSSKAPTRSTFSLPGEAVSARLKAQREERTKREEDEKSAKREFKARPAPSGRASLGPRPTLASQKRASLAKGEVAPTSKRTSVSASTIVGTKTVSRTATVGIAPKPAPATRPTAKATTTKPVVSRPSLGPPPARPANPSPNKAATAGTVPAKSGMAKPKDAFKQARTEKAKLDREKLEAAKKARADAAERGRVASREWAERRKREDEARKEKVKSANAGGGGSEGKAEKIAVA